MTDRPGLSERPGDTCPKTSFPRIRTASQVIGSSSAPGIQATRSTAKNRPDGTARVIAVSSSLRGRDQLRPLHPARKTSVAGKTSAVRTTGPPGRPRGSAPARCPAPRPARCPAPIPARCRGPVPGPCRGLTQGPCRGPVPGPCRGLTQGPCRGPVPGPCRGLTQGPGRGPVPGPCRVRIRVRCRESAPARCRERARGRRRGVGQVRCRVPTPARCPAPTSARPLELAQVRHRRRGQVRYLWPEGAPARVPILVGCRVPILVRCRELLAGPDRARAWVPDRLQGSAQARVPIPVRFRGQDPVRPHARAGGRRRVLILLRCRHQAQAPCLSSGHPCPPPILLQGRAATGSPERLAACPAERIPLPPDIARYLGPLGVTSGDEPDQEP